MVLTEAELEEGRGYVRSGDLDGLDSWVERRGIVLDRVLLRRTMGSVVVVDNARAIKLFNATFVDIDPEIDRLVRRVRTVLVVVAVLMLLLGSIGGTTYLVRLLF